MFQFNHKGLGLNEFDADEVKEIFEACDAVTRVRLISKGNFSEIVLTVEGRDHEPAYRVAHGGEFLPSVRTIAIKYKNVPE